MIARANVHRVLGWALLALLISAPTPGAVGSCGSDELSGQADLVAYCTEREELICVRRYERGDLVSVGDRDDCRREEIARCERRFWAPGCAPTKREANACLNALRSRDTLSTKEDELEECQREALCTARPPDITVDAGGNP
jgi:hypothetical protein